jgi:hypothetical protein
MCRLPPIAGGMSHPRPSLPRYRSPRLLAKLATAGFFVYAVACAWAISTLSTGVELVTDLQAGQDVSERFEAWSGSAEGLELKLFAVQLLGIVAFCVWTYRVTSNVRSWGVPGARPGWAVASYFVPILHLWVPYRALAGVWAASAPTVPGVGPRDGAGPVLAWWLLWTGSRFGSAVAAYAMRSDDLSTVATAMSAGMAVLAVELIALALALTVMWTLTLRQDQRRPHGVPGAIVI